MKTVALGTVFAIALSAAVAAQPTLETVATFGADTPPGNIAIGPDGRIFISVHGFYGQPLRVVEVHDDGSTSPYPNELWANAPDGDGPGLNGVLGLNVDRRGVLWLLDGSTETSAGRLIGWDTRAEALERIIYLAPPVTVPESFLNDLAVDREHDAIYVTDTAGPETAALIVADLATGQARRVLEGASSTAPEDIDMVIDERTITLGGAPARVGANPITIDPENVWVYFAPMSGTAMYRIRTSDLRDPDLTAAELESRVERYGDKPISDGSTVDGGGNVYITAITEDAIGVVRPDGTYQTLFTQDDLSWPDGFAYGPDDKIYVTVNELHRSPPLNEGEDGSQGEFKIMRFDALTPGVPGR
ncbi:MAG: L-dopachrome tautomerase-related protein [Pseudomonadota bacterium]